MALEPSAWQVSAAPSTEPLSTSEIKEYLDVDGTSEDTLIDNLVVAARRHVERATARALIDQTWDAYYEGFPSGQDLIVPLPPLSSVATFQYTDDGGTTTAVDSSKYEVDTDTEPGRLVLKTSEHWPTATLAANNPVHVQFTAGYGASASDVPEELRVAMRMLVNVWYQGRKEEQVASRNEMQAAERLIRQYSVRGFQ